jgi:hypothetical protein
MTTRKVLPRREARLLGGVLVLLGTFAAGTTVPDKVVVTEEVKVPTTVTKTVTVHDKMQLSSACIKALDEARSMPSDMSTVSKGAGDLIETINQAQSALAMHDIARYNKAIIRLRDIKESVGAAGISGIQSTDRLNEDLQECGK